ncbi:MBL fold metallo-hydrolase [Catellatospora citrea]|uniref:MBL fold metallo-hydrolase n=1 Tax=Catellatospora citrea TaxID=53366 RepID=A0A8J3NYR8_9ACTN|nr:MBL fold metallo-hydrolase [Catellatospora citrea]RKE05672.1 glyoxylase-like metal-dependent hydrolase (beta-lactamase superfamily II) [Catellatospora citrea]GIF97031.1 MBL fold metallo-hydrolase [Catellatospora citrea]
MASRYGDFYASKWGFPKAVTEGNAPSPQQFMPDYLNDPSFYAKGWHAENVGDGGNFYWVTSPAGYDAGFVVTGDGVVVIDAPPGLGENLQSAIRSVTREPVTHLVYSHWHSDHIGAASQFGPDVKIVAHDLTRELLARFPDKYRPLPTETFSTDAALDVGGTKLELSYKGADHCPGNIYIYGPAQKVLTKIDIVSPGSVTFAHCDVSENISGFYQAHDDILSYDFKALIGGHISRWGTREDVEVVREYWHDLLGFAEEALWEMSNAEALQGFVVGLGREHQMVGAENWINSIANYATEKTLTKTTSNGQTWPERLAGATVWTKYHAWTVAETTRTERTHHGYQAEGNGGPAYIA